MNIFSVFRRRRRAAAHEIMAYREHKEKARALVHARLLYWKDIHPFEHAQVRIKNHRRAWGSCSSKKNLNFNWRIISLPSELADYVIVHELCHTVHLNHSPAFWALLTSFVPNMRELRAQLRGVAIAPAS